MTIREFYAHVDTLDHLQDSHVSDKSFAGVVEHAVRGLELGKVVEASAEGVLQLKEGILIIEYHHQPLMCTHKIIMSENEEKFRGREHGRTETLTRSACLLHTLTSILNASLLLRKGHIPN